MRRRRRRKIQTTLMKVPRNMARIILRSRVVVTISLVSATSTSKGGCTTSILLPCRSVLMEIMEMMTEMMSLTVM